MSNFTAYKNNGGGQPVKARESSQNVNLMSRARTAPILFNRTTMKRQKFTPTPEEVAYWKRIHDLNEAERKPEPAQFIIHTIEIVKAEEVAP